MDKLRKQQRDLAKVAAALGIELSEDQVTEAVNTKSVTNQQIENSREAEAVLYYVSKPQRFTQKECNNCGGVFAVDRSNVSYCSDHCRSHSLARVGIVWDWKKPTELRWDFKEPLVIPPSVLARLQEHLETFPVAQLPVQEPEPVQEQIQVEELTAIEDLFSALS